MWNTSLRDTDFLEFGNISEAKILYASLNEQVARRDSVIRNIAGRAPFAFVRCVDGRSWDESETESHLSEAMRDRRRREFAKGRDWLTKGAIACAMTHRSNMIGQIRSSGKFCCEDDVVLSIDAIDLIGSGELPSLLEQLDGVTLLDYRSRSDIVAEKLPTARVGKYSIHRVVPRGLGSAACYFVPARYAAAIVETQTPISTPVDHWDEMIEAEAFPRLYVVHPRPARIGDFPTTIGYAYAKESTLKWYLNKVKILRRIKHKIHALRGEFNEKVTRWDKEIDE